MTKQGGLPTLVADGDIAVNAYDVPADVPQPQNSLDTLDAQLTQAVARVDPDAGALAVWTQHTIGGAGGRSVVRWYELLPGSLTVRQQGEVSSPTDFIFNGAISPSIAGNDAVVEYNRANASQTPVIGAQSRQGSTPLGTMDAGEVLLGSSTDVDQDISCSAPYGPPCRWGDYSGATPDPINPGVVWGSNMINGQSIFGFPQWTTQNFAIATGATASPDFSLSVSPASQTVAAGASTTYNVTITPAGGFGGSVALSLSGLPSGASGSFSPSTATTTFHAHRGHRFKHCHGDLSDDDHWDLWRPLAHHVGDAGRQRAQSPRLRPERSSVQPNCRPGCDRHFVFGEPSTRSTASAGR